MGLSWGQKRFISMEMYCLMNVMMMMFFFPYDKHVDSATF